jgi:hypothetical protein
MGIRQPAATSGPRPGRPLTYAFDQLCRRSLTWGISSSSSLFCILARLCFIKMARATTAPHSPTVTLTNDKLSTSEKELEEISPAPPVGPPPVDESLLLTGEQLTLRVYCIELTPLRCTGKKLALVFTAMLLSILLIALDQTILATALPRVSTVCRD